MEQVQWNSVNKKQNGLEQIENEKHKSLATARAHGYRKWRTYALVFSQTLAQENSKNEIR